MLIEKVSNGYIFIFNENKKTINENLDIYLQKIKEEIEHKFKDSRIKILQVNFESIDYRTIPKKQK